MELLYKQPPFEYEMYKKPLKISLSDEVKREFNYFYSRINDSDSLDIEELKEKYAAISKLVIAEIRENDKKSIHAPEEIQFIFVCSYLLIKKYGVSQSKLASIWGMRENQSSKLDIYPYRSYDAYEKKDYRSLSPLRKDSEGVRIAKFINKNIQAVHACYGFVGVTNDLDIFANISSTDHKSYILTEPSAALNNDMMELKYCLAHSRFLFATGNNLGNKIGDYHAGDIKKRIDNLLRMRDGSILEKSAKISDMLLDGDEYKKYVATGDVYGFKKELDKYRGQMEMLQGMEEGRSPYDVADDDEYFEYIGIDVGKIDIGNNVAFEDYLKENTKKLKSKLVRFLSYAYARPC